ncbi:MAG: hypothetical protein IKN25_03565 [Spirochaetales bacterium]|nr:hypothetical protein [Spirochaetales bacterium]
MPKLNNTLPIITNPDSKHLDTLATQLHHIPDSVLMEQAASRIYAQLCRDYDLQNERIALLVGTGNNGGDALALVRYFHKNVDYDIYLAESERYSLLNQMQQDILTSLGITFRPLSSFCDNAASYTLVIDALYGIGYRAGRTADPQLCLIAQTLRENESAVAAIDIPSGLVECNNADDGARCCICADRTYSIGFPKALFYDIATRPNCGTIVNLPISFSIDDIDDDLKQRRTYLVRQNVIAQVRRPISQFVHKYTKGAVCVIGGSRGRIGAAIHCGRAALSGGAGIVSALTNDDCLDSLNIAAPELVCDAIDNIESYLTKYQSFVIGPGVSLTSDKAAQLCQHFCRMKHTVLDASFFTHYRPDVLKKFAAPPVLTPHVGECLTFFGLDKAQLCHNTIETVRRLAAEHGVYLLLKSATQYLGTPDGIVYVIDRPNAAAAQAGSGDLLAGLIAAQLCHAENIAEAVMSAVNVFYDGIDGFLKELIKKI